MDGTQYSTASSNKPFLSLKETTIGGDSVSAAVCITPSSLRVDETLARIVLVLRPTLAQHACKQRGFGCFGDKLIGTTLPHLVEHLTIDLLVEEHGAAFPVAGTTHWLDKEHGIMRVRISCVPEHVDMTCTAINRAVALVNVLLGQ
jgi:hypothetical protein